MERFPVANLLVTVQLLALWTSVLEPSFTASMFRSYSGASLNHD